ncbi:hypothetical protein PtB15_9B363 [Puccinia triticina]|nr:hypothetical protein PtB15_9B363 [Puccinia triticina]
MPRNVADTRKLTNAPTIAIQQLNHNSLLQIHPSNIRHILTNSPVTESKSPPLSRTIVESSSNRRQVVVGLPGGELIYFKLDLDSQLDKYQEQKEMGATITSLSLSVRANGILLCTVLDSVNAQLTNTRTQ